MASGWKNDTARKEEARPLAALSGLGGHLALYPDRLEIARHGMLFSLVNLAYHVEREIRSVIWLQDLAGVHLVRSLMLVQFLRFSYPGCPPETGHYLRDAFAENAFIFSFLDNRPLLDFMRQVEAATAAIRARALPTPEKREFRHGPSRPAALHHDGCRCPWCSGFRKSRRLAGPFQPGHAFR